jgi:hypothetical protein
VLYQVENVDHQNIREFLNSLGQLSIPIILKPSLYIVTCKQKLACVYQVENVNFLDVHTSWEQFSIHMISSNTSTYKLEGSKKSKLARLAYYM